MPALGPLIVAHVSQYLRSLYSHTFKHGDTQQRLVTHPECHQGNCQPPRFL